MRYFVFLDRYDLLPALAGLADGGEEMIVVKIGAAQAGPAPAFAGRLFEWKELYLDEVGKLDISAADRVIVSGEGPFSLAGLVESLSSLAPAPPILVLASRGGAADLERLPNVSVMNLSALVKKNIITEWSFIRTRQKVHRLREVLSGARKILIMTQNDPDPDAIASGLAAQAILERDEASAPICSFGQVTRKENINMLRLLRARIHTITPASLGEFDGILMVDVQPPYFPEGVFTRVDAVIDHHPYPAEYEAAFRDVSASCGATSTILYEYLAAAKTSISRGLATALLYGIITDTMNLSRDTSRRDFEAFSSLWPFGNSHMLSSMSRPRLDQQELSYFVRAINNRREEGDLVFMWLGNIEREDIIPRLADFSLQIGEGAWTAVGGVYEGDVIVSLRNMSASNISAGDVAASLFSEFGSAGGHHSMAKAVMPFAPLKKALSLKNLKQTGEKLFNMISQAIEPGARGLPSNPG